MRTYVKNKQDYIEFNFLLVKNALITRINEYIAV